ncbi:hypothetical protein COCMIDRAFT_95077 [Bipolaris oryzae ATCC 44560]|uniref:Uncharacterized protein n=1 Tax=Bipolaris oryzae ATCC 44560 TaxID=930090 RepID=W6ZDN0_COCMI|nr:uncharacterized protein COCMIDRAFT_95077 [Bipolaris oryzae ATCC 44560]EUC45584.1 hypothetical protein COCMIDRAFT_95077 [Bipolaris oryzae ATCC 44560]
MSASASIPIGSFHPSLSNDVTICIRGIAPDIGGAELFSARFFCPASERSRVRRPYRSDYRRSSASNATSARRMHCGVTITWIPHMRMEYPLPFVEPS